MYECETYYVEADDDEITFDSLDDAIEFAEEHGAETICGGFDEYRKCWFCGEWYTTGELEKDLCWRCKNAIWSRGEEI